MADSWRVCMICTIRPIAEVLSSTLRELGHEPVALVAPRRPDSDEQPEFLRLTSAGAPTGVDLLFAKDKWSIERLLGAYEPDLTVCWGFPWKIPQAALDVARLGSINGHPALLPRHRGPIPFAWTLRAGDSDWGFTWHRMDAELDTGNILAQASDRSGTTTATSPSTGRGCCRRRPRSSRRRSTGSRSATRATRSRRKA